MERNNTLSLTRLGIDTYNDAVIFIRKDCPVCLSEGFEVHARVHVSLNKKSILATLYMIDGDLFGSSVFHWFNGAVMLGAFFIATDPVSASTTPKGRLIFGAAIGFWTVIIRTFGGYPDAIAFSVVIMNMAVPLIDYYTQPTVYGQRHSAKNRGNGDQ